VRFFCWLQYDHTEEDGVEIDAFDADDAACDACDKWNELGVWAGEAFPDSIEVYVRNLDTRELFTVNVGTSWDVSFHGSDPKPVAEPR
jgi:hypothetical protein